jgi:PST family polysaccharide transporter
MRPLSRRFVRSAALRNTAWLLGERLVTLTVGFVVGVLMARYLGPSDFGRLSLLTAVIAFMAPLAALGLDGIVTRELVTNASKEPFILGTAAVLRVIGACTALALLWSVAQFGDWFPPGDRTWLLILGVAELFAALAVVDTWFQAKVLSRPAVVTRTSIFALSSLAKLLLVAAQAKFGYFIVVQALQTAFTSLGLLATYAKIAGQLTSWRYKPSLARSMLAESWWLIPSGFSAVIYLKLDQIMLGAMVGMEEVGLYAVAARLSEVWYFLPIALVQSYFPRLLELRASSLSAYRNRLQRLFDVLFWLAFLVALTMTFIASPLMATIYGESFRPAGSILAIHVWAGIFIFMRSLLSKWLIAEQLTRFSLFTHGLGAIVNIAANWALIPLYGGRGAAMATLVSYAMASWLALFMHRRTRDIGIMMVLAPLAPFRYLLGRAF